MIGQVPVIKTKKYKERREALMLALHDLECGCEFPNTHITVWEGLADKIIKNLPIRPTNIGRS